MAFYILWSLYSKSCTTVSIFFITHCNWLQFMCCGSVVELIHHCVLASFTLNSMTLRRCGNNSKSIISDNMPRIKFMNNSCESAPMWMPHNTFADKSALDEVMVWYRQATSHYLSQCWRRSVSPYGVTRSQWVEEGGDAFINVFWTHLICI